MAVKAINDSAGLNGIVLILLVFGAYCYSIGRIQGGQEWGTTPYLG
jgi:hypothetical protein